MGSRYISTEKTYYDDGSKTVEDVYQKNDGTLFVNTYNVTADESKHDHVAMDENGNFMGGHEERKSSWSDKHAICILLANLTFEELQIVEALHENEYVRLSARRMLNYNNYDLEENRKKSLKMF